MKNKFVMTALVLTVVGAGLATSGKIFAQTPTSTDPISTLVQKIADKFGLNKADVQAVFDQERAARHAEMLAKHEERLTQLVKDGKITEAQKQLIIAKHKELQTTGQAKKQEMQEWAQKNGIDLQYLMGGFGKHGGWKMGRM